MWILINNKPFNLETLDDVTEVRLLDEKFFRCPPEYYLAATEKIPENLINQFEKEVNDFLGNDISNEEKYIKEIQKRIVNENFYYFIIGTNKKKAGQYLEYICSKMYKSKEEAQEHLNSFLSLINQIYATLPSIRI